MSTATIDQAVTSRAPARPSERATVAIRDDVLRVTRGHPAHWVMVHDIAHRLGLDDDVVEAAVRRAIDEGWFIGDGEPPHSVRLSTTFTRTFC